MIEICKTAPMLTKSIRNDLQSLPTGRRKGEIYSSYPLVVHKLKMMFPSDHNEIVHIKE